MKSEIIIHSWSKIKADDAAHGRILGNILDRVHSGETKRPVWKVLVPVAACFAALLVGVWAVPRMGNENIAPPNLQAPPYAIMPGTAAPTDTSGQVREALPAAPSMYALTLNKIFSQTEPRLFIPGHFWHELTAEQVHAVLPNGGVGFPVSATAHYYDDGVLFDVSIIEIQPDGSTAKFNDLFMRTTIQISPGAIFTCALFDYDPVISYVHGIPVTAGVFDRNFAGYANDNAALYIANFELSGISYRIQLNDSAAGDSGQNRLTEIVNTIIQNGVADLSVLESPVIPELRDERLTFEEVRAYPGFGVFFPENAPRGFAFDYARRMLTQDFNGILAFWNAGMNSIRWQVSRPTAHDLAHVVSIYEREKFDLSLYSIPFAESVPLELSQFVMNPVFLAEELTLDAVRARQLYSRGHSQMNFAVLFGDIVVNISVTGMQPEQVWEMILDIK